MKNLLLMHEGRVGSTALAEQICQRTDQKIVSGGEIYSRMRLSKCRFDLALKWNTAKTIIPNALNKWPNYVLHEYKVFPETDHMRRSGVESLEGLLDIAKKNNTIFLLRQNILDRALSVFLGQQTKIWHSTSASEKNEGTIYAGVEVPLKDFFLGGLFYPDWGVLHRIHSEFQKRLVSMAEKEGIAILYYEDIFNDECVDIDRVFDCYKINIETVPHSELGVGVRKSRPMYERVKNYIEVQNEFLRIAN